MHAFHFKSKVSLGAPAGVRPISELRRPGRCTANLRTKGFDSGRILILRGRILMSIGDFPEIVSRGILVGIVLVGRLGVHAEARVAFVVFQVAFRRLRTRGRRHVEMMPPLVRF